MPPADNTAALAEATRRRSRRARTNAERAIAVAQRTGNHTSFAAIAKVAGVSRSWLYTQQDLVTAIRQLQNRQPSSHRTGSQPASIASIQRRLDVALARIKQLRTENSDLAARLEMAYGEIRRLRGISHSGGLEPEKQENNVPSCAPRTTAKKRLPTGAGHQPDGYMPGSDGTPVE
ncbi:DUF6262 family protein [Streptomyces leeuwenhoekii]|uniref:Transposase, putative n=1 Tax=Streptomyces leeuwenhoekii TaxID=1437453 RepID=A0A0F7VPT9_STRLW|nr:DUF6262 family protein [Streptomyces leeuwenhoekii]CQR59377.1 transposase, putative [Streptomyces leeuwenhoekii]